MRNHVTFDYSRAEAFFSQEELRMMSRQALDAMGVLLGRRGAGSDLLGWLDLPGNIDKEELARIKKAAARIRKNSEVLLVIGIGGSCPGARAAVEFLGHSFSNILDREKRGAPEIYFCGNSFSSTFLKHLTDVVGDRDFSIHMISRSGTDMEPALAFRVFRELLEKKYGRKEAAGRIYATTDQEKGALRQLAEQEGYEIFPMPDDVGGCFSVLTPAGLLPIAVSGADIDKLMRGAASARECALKNAFVENGALQYAALRNIFLRRGKSVEIMCHYEPGIHSISEWWKQLFGESEGKYHRGLLPVSVDLAAELYSMGQFIQEGSRLMFETIIDIEKCGEEISVNEEPGNPDGLNDLAGRTVDSVGKNAVDSVILAHTEGQVPSLLVHVPEANEFYLGELFYFFEFACAISGYMLGVNPFSRPGVENYRKNLYALLGKPGYEQRREELYSYTNGME